MAGFREAMVGSGQLIAVEDAQVITGDRLRESDLQAPEQRFELPGRVANQFGGHRGLDAGQLVVNGGEGDGQALAQGAIGGADGRILVADDQAHQIDDGREEQFAGVLALGLLSE